MSDSLQIKFRAGNATVEALKLVAAARGVSMSDVINKALQQVVESAAIEERVKMQIRLPPTVHAELKRRAQKNRISMNAEIVRTLEAEFGGSQ